jgi:hypothetical protein
VKPGIFTEDSTEAHYFMSMFPEHILDVLTAETNIYIHPKMIKVT